MTAATSFGGGISNNGTITTGKSGVVVVDASNFSGGITNSGTISVFKNPINVTVSSSTFGPHTFSGGIVNAQTGSITGRSGIRADNIGSFSGGVLNAGQIVSAQSGINVGAGLAFSGGIINAASGSIIAGYTGISTTLLTSFTGGITNSGTITAVGEGIGVFDITSFAGGVRNDGVVSSSSSAAIYIDNIASFGGGITNSGTLSSAKTGIALRSSSLFVGGISNGGQITAGSSGVYVHLVSTFLGGIQNSGTIVAPTSGIHVGAVSLFGGGISNTGTISVSGGTGVYVTETSTFAGGISNSGSIAAGNVGIVYGGVYSASGASRLFTTFSGGIQNSGMITAGQTGILAGGFISGTNILLEITNFAGGISNSGTISSGGDGVVVGGSVTSSAQSAALKIDTFANGITNGGLINAAGAAILLGGNTTVTGSTGTATLTISTFTGGIANSGTISGGQYGIEAKNVQTFSGGITNSAQGSIGATVHDAVVVTNALSFAGGITNSVGATIAGVDNGIRLSAISAFSGGITNQGSIVASGSGNTYAINIDTVSSFDGGIQNSGTLSAQNHEGIYIHGGSAFSGGVSNSGLILSQVEGIEVRTLSVFSGGITNTGTMSVGTGVSVDIVSTFTGSIVNNGTITGPSTIGVSIGQVSTFVGGITNNGVISGGTFAGIVLYGPVRSFSGNISNSGSITNPTGILFYNPGITLAGAIVNSGTITGTSGTAIDVSNATSPVTIDQNAGTITGAIKLSASADVLNIAGGVINGNVVGQGAADTVNFNLGSGSFTYASAYTMSGLNAAAVNSGTVIVNGTIQAATPIAVANGATLTGAGTVSDVTVASGGTIAGTQGQTLTTGNLTLMSGAHMAATVSSAGNSAPLFAVNGNASLSGVLDLTSSTGAFGQGVYKILTYSGTLSGSGLTFGTIAGSVNVPNLAIQTSVANVVNVVSGASTASFWNGGNAGNGTVQGGGGTWDANTIWTNASATNSGPIGANAFGVFEGTPGTVTISNAAGAISTGGLQFVTSGYTLNGDPLTLANAQTTVRVGDGTMSGAATTALIAANLIGSGGLLKTDLGALTLSGTDSYSGATTVNAGTLNVTGSIASSATTVNSGGTLTGTGTTGDVTVASGGTIAGTQGRTLTTGNLTLMSGAHMAASLGGTAGNGAPLFAVNGNAALSGVLDLTSSTGAFGQGVYKILSYSGTLSGSGLTLGTIAGSVNVPNLAIQTSVANVVNVVSGASTTSFWNGGNAGNGTVQGGGGTWDANTIWTNGGATYSAAIGAGGFGIFEGTPGTVTISNAAGAISTGGLQFVASGYTLNGDPLTLANAQTTVRVGDGTTSGAATTATIAANLTGSGGLLKTDLGVLTLAGVDSYSGATTVNAGTLNVTGSIASSATTVNSGGTLTGTGTTGDVTVASGGTIAGTQGQTLTTGNLTLASGAHMAASLGGTAGNSAALFAVNGNASLSGVLDLTTSAGAFGQGVYKILSYSGTLSGSGLTLGTIAGSVNVPYLAIQTSVPNVVNVVSGGPTPASYWNGGQGGQGTVQGGDGTWDANTIWTNSAAANSAAIQAQAFAIFESAPGTVTISTASGPVTIGGMQFVTNGYVLTGGSLILTNAQTTVRVGDGTTSGAATTVMIASDLIGSGGLVKTDYGTVALTGANTYTGGTQVDTGTLALGNASAAGTGAVSLNEGTVLSFLNGFTFANALAFPQLGDPVIDTGPNNVTMSGPITGVGSLSKIGSGTLDLTGTNTYTGGTEVVAGTLLVDGSTATSAALVDNGATLGGSGTVGGITTLSGGTVAPGAAVPFSTLNVAGNVIFNAGSVYQVQVNAAGQTDAIAATGTATINGGTVNVIAGNGTYVPATTYRILTAAGGRTGQFNALTTTSNLAFLTPLLTYGATTVDLGFTRALVGPYPGAPVVDFASVAATRNQRAAATGIATLGGGNALYDAVLSQSAPGARQAYNAASGEVHASVATAALEDGRVVDTAIIARMLDADGVATSGDRYRDAHAAASAIGVAHFTLWGQAFGRFGTNHGDGNASTIKSSLGGFVPAETPLSMGPRSAIGGSDSSAVTPTTPCR